ncbi:MAG: hypothetical protein E7675_07920 [Ruminococcaceae bacterium]|nr:hypothetical protein [Oscillospiraceae bacterium]
MKKYLLLLLVLVCTVSAASCNKSDIDPLQYQTYPFYVEGCLTADDTEYSFSLTMTSSDESEISFSKPDSLRGYVFNVTPEGTTLSYGDMTIDFDGAEKTSLVRLIPSLFALEKEDHISSETTVLNSVDILLSKYATDTGDVSVYLNKSTATPVRFEGNGFVLDVLKFTKDQNSVPTATPEGEKTPNATKEPAPTQLNNSKN